MYSQFMMHGQKNIKFKHSVLLSVFQHNGISEIKIYRHKLTKDNKQNTNETDDKYTETRHKTNKQNKKYDRKLDIKYYGKSPKPRRKNPDNLI